LVSILGNDSRGTVLSTTATMDYWLSLDTCQLIKDQKLFVNKRAEAGATIDQISIEQTFWQCNGTTKAMVYKMIGAGHTIPHPKNIMPKIMGATNQDINAAVEIWAFFKLQRT